MIPRVSVIAGYHCVCKDSQQLGVSSLSTVSQSLLAHSELNITTKYCFSAIEKSFFRTSGLTSSFCGQTITFLLILSLFLFLLSLSLSLSLALTLSIHMLYIIHRPTERGGGGGISPGPGLIGGPEHLCRCLYCKLLQSILCYQNATFSSIFKISSGAVPPTPLYNKTKAFMQHNMYRDRYTRGPKLKLSQGPIILSAALIIQ